MVFLYIIFILNVGNYVYQGYIITTSSILAIMQTNYNESLEFLEQFFSLKFLGFICICFIFYFVLIWKFIKTTCFDHKNIKVEIRYILAGAVCMVFAVSYITKTIVFECFIDSYNRYNQIKTFECKLADSGNLLDVKKNDKIRSGKYLVIIGESQNRDFFNYYGYYKETTPWLSSLANKENAIKISNAFSNSANTVDSLMYALTEKSQYNNVDLNEAASIVDILKKNDFHTYWISNQAKYGIFSSPITSIANRCDESIWLNDRNETSDLSNFYDSKIVDVLSNIVLKENSVVFIHLMGSHSAYKDRYPSIFNKFGTDYIESYENSIYYNDFVIEKLYRDIYIKNDFNGLIYFSDHGEDVVNKLGHSNDICNISMIKIPMYIVLSETYIKKYKETYDNLIINKESGFTNDLIYDLILGIVGYNGNRYYPEQDISSKSYNFNINNIKTLHGEKYIKNIEE